MTEQERESVALARELFEINQATQASRWQQSEFTKALAQDSLATFILSVEPSTPQGFAIFSVVAPEAHLVNLAVAPSLQKQGYGRQLMQHSFDCLKQEGISECWLEVRESNLRAQKFYKDLGFNLHQKRPGFYKEPDEDGWLMVAYF